jgi:hypothetical protein
VNLPVGLALVLLLGCGVLWLAQRACRAAVRPEESGPGFVRMLLILFAWSFVLGVVMRWVRLSA